MPKNLINEYNTILEVEKATLKKYKDNLSYKRDDFFNIPWSDSCIGLFGERGVGKTTILLQKRLETENSLYLSADHTIIRANGLFDFVMYCSFEIEIKTFFIDEIFRYENWKIELKNIIDTFDINIYFSGSSSMAIYDGVVDLGRRVYEYKINTLSFREFLKLKYKIDLPKITFRELIENHTKLSLKYNLEFKQKYFKEYLKSGAYPFGLNSDYDVFLVKLQNTIDRVLLEDLKYIRNYETQSLNKLSKLIYFIATTTPSELSISHLSHKIELDKNVVDNTLYLLNKIGIVNLVQKGENLSQKVRKEFKIFLGDTNKYYVNNLEPEIGTIREAFFVSEIKKLNNHLDKIEISLPKSGDFKVEFLAKETYNFEIGGKAKKSGKYPKNTFIVKDDINVSENDKVIPLWLFGFLN